jgi:hypothetical protein
MRDYTIFNPPAELPWKEREDEEDERAIFDDEEIFPFPYTPLERSPGPSQDRGRA